MGKKTVLFRCDASPEIGLGHIVRCLALAREMADRSQITFASRPDNTNRLIADAGFRLACQANDSSEEAFLDRVVKEEKPDVLVIDTKYPYSSSTVRKLKGSVAIIVLIDNICEGMKECDFTVFPNAHQDTAQLSGYLPPGSRTKLLTGPEYVILREEVLSMHPGGGTHVPPDIVVTTGGSDPEGVMLQILPWLKESGLNVTFKVLLGQAFKHKNDVLALEAELPSNFRLLPYSLSHINQADIAMCTFGMSIYEMIYLRKPAICISHSRENAGGARLLQGRYGVIEDAGYIGDLTPEHLRQSIANLLDEPKRHMLVRRCTGFIDGKGAMRIAKLILS